MEKPSSQIMSRRSFALSTLVFGAGLLMAPDRALAAGVSGVGGEPASKEYYLVHPELTWEEFEALAQKEAEAQVQAEIERLLKQEYPSGIIPFDRTNDFSTTYGKKTFVTTPYVAVAGQLPGGTKFQGGGTIHVVPTGGGTINLTYSFPTPFGSIGVSGPLGKKVSYTTDYGVYIPAGAYYKATQSDGLYCTPYAIYRTVNGKKTLVNRGASSTHYNQAFSYVRV